MPFSDALQSAFPPGLQSLGFQTFDDDSSSIFIGQAEIVAITQRIIYVACQAVVLALIVVTGVSLVVSIWRLTAHPDTATTVLASVSALGSIVVGGAAVFIQRIANEARANFDSAEQHVRTLRGVDAANR